MVVFGLFFRVFGGFGCVFCLFLGVIWCWFAAVLLLVCLNWCVVVLSVSELDGGRARYSLLSSFSLKRAVLVDCFMSQDILVSCTRGNTFNNLSLTILSISFICMR